MKISVNLRKYLSLVLCLCVSIFNMPVYASTSSNAAEEEYVKVELTDAAMSKAVGAGQVDATMVDFHKGDSQVQAVVVNRSTTLDCTYELNLVNVNGVVLQTLTSGSLPMGSAKLISTPTPVTDADIFQVRLWNGGVPGLESKDTSWVFN